MAAPTRLCVLGRNRDESHLAALNLGMEDTLDALVQGILHSNPTRTRYSKMQLLCHFLVTRTRWYFPKTNFVDISATIAIRNSIVSVEVCPFAVESATMIAAHLARSPT